MQLGLPMSHKCLVVLGSCITGHTRCRRFSTDIQVVGRVRCRDLECENEKRRQTRAKHGVQQRRCLRLSARQELDPLNGLWHLMGKPQPPSPASPPPPVLLAITATPSSMHSGQRRASCGRAFLVHPKSMNNTARLVAGPADATPSATTW